MRHDDFAVRFWEEQRLSRGTREERLRSKGITWGEVHELIWNHDDQIVDLLIRLAETAPSDDDAGLIGAGPIEELLYENRERLDEASDGLLERIDAAARRSPRFRMALSSALLVDLPEEVVRRLSRFR